jgi:hypothetical protein
MRAALPSSHSSPTSTTPSPQAGGGAPVDVPSVALLVDALLSLVDELPSPVVLVDVLEVWPSVPPPPPVGWSVVLDGPPVVAVGSGVVVEPIAVVEPALADTLLEALPSSPHPTAPAQRIKIARLHAAIVTTPSTDSQLAEIDRARQAAAGEGRWRSGGRGSRPGARGRWACRVSPRGSSRR